MISIGPFPADAHTRPNGWSQEQVAGLRTLIDLFAKHGTPSRWLTFLNIGQHISAEDLHNVTGAVKLLCDLKIASVANIASYPSDLRATADTIILETNLDDRMVALLVNGRTQQDIATASIPIRCHNCGADQEEH
jgi:hypothetical protein